MYRKRPLQVEEIDSICKAAERIVILEEIENPTNVGAVFRSAAALGVDAVLLTKGCADPLQRRAARVSMGTVFQLPWAFLPEEGYGWPREGLERLRRNGFRSAAMALKEDALSIREIKLSGEDKLAIVLGTEGDGLAEETIAACDDTVIIPMYHGVDSLNVAAAGAVAFWELCASRRTGHRSGRLLGSGGDNAAQT